MHKTLTMFEPTKTEKDLYYYGGYYLYSSTDDSITYVCTDARGNGYTKRTICPGAINTNIDDSMLSKKIVFHTAAKTVSTSMIEMDMELLSLITKRAEELGFSIDPEESLYKKIREWQVNDEKLTDMLAFTQEELSLLMRTYADK